MWVPETAGRAPPARPPPLWACACPRPGSFPAPISTRAWERERARVRGQIATEMFSSPQGKKNLYKISTSYPTTHIQHLGDSRVLLFSRILLVVTAALLLWLVLVYSWGQSQGQPRTSARSPRQFPLSLLVRSPSQPQESLEQPLGKGMGGWAGWQPPSPGLGRGSCPCCIPPPSTIPLVHHIHPLSP